jgi:hypothetical protein
VNVLSRHSEHLARFLRDLFWGPPKPKLNPEQQAAMYLYSTDARRVRAVPTRRPVTRKAS